MNSSATERTYDRRHVHLANFISYLYTPQKWIRLHWFCVYYGTLYVRFIFSAKYLMFTDLGQSYLSVYEVIEFPSCASDLIMQNYEDTWLCADDP